MPPSTLPIFIRMPGDVVGSHDIPQRLVAPASFGCCHQQPLVQGLARRVDVKWVDRQDMWLKLLMSACVLREHDYAIRSID